MLAKEKWESMELHGGFIDIWCAGKWRDEDTFECYRGPDADCAECLERWRNSVISNAPMRTTVKSEETNLDLLRAMSAEDLAKLFCPQSEVAGESFFTCPVGANCVGDCRPCFLRWLNAAAR